jgi:hypothetical protein
MKIIRTALKADYADGVGNVTVQYSTKKENNKMLTKYQKFALDHYLCYYPDNMSFNEILNLIVSENELESEQVEIAEYFETTPPEIVRDFIAHMASDLEEKFIAKLEGNKKPLLDGKKYAITFNGQDKITLIIAENRLRIYIDMYDYNKEEDNIIINKAFDIKTLVEFLYKEFTE